MKKLFVIILLSLSIDSLASNIKHSSHYVDTTVLTSIQTLPLSTYIGKPVDSLLSILPSGYTHRIFVPRSLGYAKGVAQGYVTDDLNHCFVEIFIDTFQFMTFPNYSKTTTWDMSLAKKETIAFIKVYKNNTCIYGCNNPSYQD